MRRLLLMTVCCCLGAAASLLSAQEFSVGNYQLVSSRRVSVTQVLVTYSAVLMNTGVGRSSVTAVLIPVGLGFITVAGQDALVFYPVAAGSQTTSVNTFSLIVDRTLPFEFSKLVWVYSVPGLIPSNVTAGKDLELPTSMSFGEPAPRGGTTHKR